MCEEQGATSLCMYNTSASEERAQGYAAGKSHWKLHRFQQTLDKVTVVRLCKKVEDCLHMDKTTGY